VTSLSEFLAQLASQLPGGASDPTQGLRLTVDRVEMDLPIESHAAPGQFGASLPRGRWRSGMDPPTGTLFARWDRSGE